MPTIEPTEMDKARSFALGEYPSDYERGLCPCCERWVGEDKLDEVSGLCECCMEDIDGDRP